MGSLTLSCGLWAVSIISLTGRVSTFNDPGLMKTPVVRNGKQATVGYAPEIWKTWE